MMISPPRGSAYRQSIKNPLWFLMQPPRGVFSLFSITHKLSASLSPASSAHFQSNANLKIVTINLADSNACEILIQFLKVKLNTNYEHLQEA